MNRRANPRSTRPDHRALAYAGHRPIEDALGETAAGRRRAMAVLANRLYAWLLGGRMLHLGRPWPK